MDIVMPQLGETVAEGTVMVWHKKVGDKVLADELLFEVGTDKVETEIPAPASGVLTEILVDEGETVDVGTRLAVIDDGGAKAEKAKPLATDPGAAKPKAAKPAPARASQAPRAAKGERLSPVVRKLLAEHGLEASDVQGSGRDGRLTRRDVLAHVKGAPAPAPARAPAGKSPVGKSEVIPFSRIRKRTAEHMVRSKATSPHVLQAVEVEFHQVDAARTTKGKAWRAREGFTLTYLPFIARATCLAIPEFPRVNATVDGESLVVHGGINLAIAVDLGFDGLVAPVIPDAHAKSVADLAYEIHALAKKARAGRLSPDDVAGATYTLSNSGSFGTLITAPIINQPQVAILSADGVRKKPVVVEGEAGDAIAIRPVGILAQSFDHRAMDGAYSAAFLRRLKEIIETTDWTAELN